MFCHMALRHRRSLGRDIQAARHLMRPGLTGVRSTKLPLPMYRSHGFTIELERVCGRRYRSASCAAANDPPSPACTLNLDAEHTCHYNAAAGVAATPRCGDGSATPLGCTVVHDVADDGSSSMVSQLGTVHSCAALPLSFEIRLGARTQQRSYAPLTHPGNSIL